MTEAIKITKANTARIDAAISEAEGKATARCAAYRDVEAAVEAAEERLALLPQRMWVGATASYDRHVVPQSYRYAAESTHVEIERRASGWYFTGARRATTARRSYGAGAGTIRVTLPEQPALLATILDRAGITLTTTGA